MQSSDKAFPRVQIAELNSQLHTFFFFFLYCGTNILLFVPVSPFAHRMEERQVSGVDKFNDCKALRPLESGVVDW